MAPPLPVAPGPGVPTKQISFALAVVNYLEYLSGINSIPDTVINGSFEVFTGATPNTPDNWLFTAYAGSGNVDQTSEAADGQNSFKITVPSSGGGGYLQSNIILPWNSEKDFWASWSYQVDNPNVSNRVDVVWFDRLGVQIEVQNLWQASSGQSTSWIQNGGHIPAFEGTSGSTTIPSNAEFYALRLTGGITSATQAGHVWYDNVKTGWSPVNRRKSLFFSALGSFLIPDGCTSIEIDMVAAGGGGGGGGVSGNGSGGGSGAFNTIQIDVVPGNKIDIVLGGQGGGGSLNSSGGNAAASKIKLNGSIIYTLNGGTGGGGNTGSVGIGGTGINFDGAHVIRYGVGQNGSLGTSDPASGGGGATAGEDSLAQYGFGGAGGVTTGGNGGQAYAVIHY